MKNTPVNQTLFAANYIGCQVDLSETEYGKIEAYRLKSCELIGVKTKVGNYFAIQTNIKSQNKGLLWLNPNVCPLSLRSLYSITDAELKELIEIITEQSIIEIECKKHDFVRSLVTHVGGWKGIFTLNYEDATFYISNSVTKNLLSGYQYLLSKGFALSWREVSVETLIKWNWIKLI